MRRSPIGTHVPKRTATDVLADWARLYRCFLHHLDSVDVFFDGYAEDDAGAENRDYECFCIYVHRQSVDEHFRIGDRSRFLNLVITQPENAACFYVWLTSDGKVDSVSIIEKENAWAESVILKLDARYQLYSVYDDVLPPLGELGTAVDKLS